MSRARIACGNHVPRYRLAEEKYGTRIHRYAAVEALRRDFEKIASLLRGNAGIVDETIQTSPSREDRSKQDSVKSEIRYVTRNENAFRAGSSDLLC